MDGYKNRLEAEAKRDDQLNHMLGQYIAVAVIDPKHYPDKPQLSGPAKKQTRPPEEFRQIMKKRYGKK